MAKATGAGNTRLVFPTHGCHFALLVPGTAAVTEAVSARRSAD